MHLLVYRSFNSIGLKFTSCLDILLQDTIAYIAALLVENMSDSPIISSDGVYVVG